MNYTNDEIGAIVQEFLKIEAGIAPEVISLAKGGSKRSFYRVRFGRGEGVIFMHYNSEHRENCHYVPLAGFLQKIGVPAPRIFHHDGENNFLIMEDLGDRDLWHYRHSPWAVRKNYYFKVLDIIGKLHAFQQEDLPNFDIPLMEPFGPELYSWECEYFLQNFARAFCQIELTVTEAGELEEELAALAETLSSLTPCLIHRDLQSQNVMICGDEPALIDFQGMRCGVLFYDLGSLLYDPYVTFTGEERDELLDYYYENCRTAYDRQSFQRFFRLAAAQRLMQALGAYGFLGLKGNHPEFLSHIPAGLGNLIDTIGADPHLSHLRQLALRCRQAIE